MDKAYILTFDRDLTTDYNALHDGIKNDHNIRNWWHYMLSTYLLLSPMSGTELGDSIRKYFPNHRFLLLQVKLSNRRGWLPQKAWEWIKRYTTL